MSDTILIRGFTASDPALSTLPNGVPVVNFRLASTPRWQDATGTWKEGTTNWYTCLLYTSPSPRDVEESRMPSSA